MSAVATELKTENSQPETVFMKIHIKNGRLIDPASGTDAERDVSHAAVADHFAAGDCLSSSVRNSSSFCATNFLYPSGSMNGFGAPGFIFATLSSMPK